MQQTQTYKLNKPGVDDPITPVPLNENADKIEAALLAESAAREALDGRVQVLELHRIAVGRCGSGVGNHITLDFQPKVVIAIGHSAAAIGMQNFSPSASNGTQVVISTDGYAFTLGGDLTYGAAVYLALA